MAFYLKEGMTRCARCEGSSRKPPKHSDCMKGSCTCKCRTYRDDVKPNDLADFQNINKDEESWRDQMERARQIFGIKKTTNPED